MEELALLTPVIVDGGRKHARQQLVADSGHYALHPPPEGGRELHFDAPPGSSVPHAPGWDIHIQHFFQAKGLCAKLQVGGETVSRAGFVLDGVDVPSLHLDDVRSAGQTQGFGPKRDSSEHSLAAFSTVSSAVNPTMRPRAADRVRIVAPHTVAVDKGALSRAVGEVLDRRDRHHAYGRHRRLAPMARVASAFARRS